MKRQSGFTLIEVIIVIIILALIAGASLPVVSAVLDAEKKAATIESMDALEKAILAYYEDTYRNYAAPGTGAFNTLADPTGTNGNLRRLYDNTAGVPANWKGPYINQSGSSATDPNNSVIFDKWKRPYRVTVLAPSGANINPRIQVLSMGPNGVTGAAGSAAAADDIVRIINPVHILREKTLEEITVINAAINAYYRYKYTGGPVLTAANWYSTLTTASLLPANPQYQTDEWGTSYNFDGQRVWSSNMRPY